MRRPLASAIAPLVLLVPACGNDRADAPPRELVVAAAAKTTDAKSARVFMTMEMQAAEKVTATMEGGIDFVSRRGRFEMSMPQLSEVFGSDKVEMVLDGLVVYMKIPSGAEIPPQLAAKPWLKLDMQALGQQQGLDLGALTQMGGSDPSASLDYLRGASDDVAEVGKEQVRGTDTTRYKGTLDLDRAAAQAPANAKETLTKLGRQLGTKLFPFEVWLDADGLTRKMGVTIDLSKAQGAGQAGLKSMAMDMELYDFGTDVQATVPAAGDTTDLAKLLKDLGGSGEYGG